MVRKCAWGTCRSDTRYPERLTGGVRFIPFPRWKKTQPSNREKCLRWIKACNRPHEQLNLSLVEKSYNYYICTKHFLDGAPSGRYPDPVVATATSASEEQLQQGSMKPSRPRPKDRSSSCSEPLRKRARKTLAVSEPAVEEIQQTAGISSSNSNSAVATLSSDQQATGSLGLDMLAAASDLQTKQTELEDMRAKVKQLQELCAKERLQNEELRRELQNHKEGQARWTTEKIQKKMKYYTGFTYDKFKMILKILAPKDELPFEPPKKLKKCTKDLSVEQQFLLVMIKLKQNVDFSHLAELFLITETQVGHLFKEWINYMYFRFGEILTWPDRKVLIENMPEKFKQDFPATVAILDGTEIKSEKPSALKSQSQFYSDYKSSTTLKGLVAVDPKGSFIFISMLFSGSISDKEICKKSGLMKQLDCLKQHEKLLPGDGIMVDKGFHISNEINELGLKLWIPPFASSGSQMSAADVAKTKKIAKHRIIVENAIGRAKHFKIIKQTISLNLFPLINQIWFCCCFLTNFMPCLRK